MKSFVNPHFPLTFQIAYTTPQIAGQKHDFELFRKCGVGLKNRVEKSGVDFFVAFGIYCFPKILFFIITWSDPVGHREFPTCTQSVPETLKIPRNGRFRSMWFLKNPTGKYYLMAKLHCFEGALFRQSASSFHAQNTNH